MDWNEPRFSSTYLPKQLGAHTVHSFVAEIEQGLPRTRLRYVDVEWWDKGYKCKTCWPGLVELEQRLQQGQLRKFTMSFGRPPLKPKTHDHFFPELEFVSRASDFSEDKAWPRISLHGCRCHRKDFLLFREIAVRVLELTVHPEHETEFEDGHICYLCRNASLDEVLWSHIEGSLSTRQFDVAIKAAIGVVETRLRERCVALGRIEAQKQTGSDLAVTAYHKDSGCLTPPWPLAAEAIHGAQMTFQGFFLWIRNAYAHHATVMGKNRSAVFETLMYCQFLLRILEESTERS